MILNETRRLGRAVGSNLRLDVYPRELRLILLVVGLALAGGLMTARLGVLTIPIAGVFLLAVLLVIFGYRLWWKLLIFLLIGYLFFSKGFATVGFFPVYVGEAMIGIGILTLILSPFVDTIKVRFKPFFHWEIGILMLFLIWQVLQTIPYFGAYKFETLRDAVFYGYAVFAILIMLMTPKRDVEKFFNLYGYLVPLMVLWFPILHTVSRLNLVPIYFPGASVPIINTKGSDVGVHLAGIGAYMLLQLNSGLKIPRLVNGLTWLLWIVDVVLLGSIGRAVLVATAASAAIVVLFRPLTSRWDRPLMLVAIIIALLLLSGLYSTLKLDLGLYREVSAEQLVDNITSIFGDSGTGLEGTKQWRLEWWDTIINYTFHGQYFWTGKGYGINLANSDGFQVDLDNSTLRSPHNGHMTVLARSGVPGFILWVIFLGGLALRLAVAALRYKLDPLKARYALWLLAYLVAFGIIGGLDVFLESPMGGIWFWALVGFAYVYLTPDDAPAPSKPNLVLRK